MRENATQRDHDLRDVFNGLSWMTRGGSSWRMPAHDLPPWHTVCRQARRWLSAGVFEAIVHDLRTVIRVAQGKEEEPSAAIFDGRTLQSTRESGTRACYVGAKIKRGGKVHMAVDTIGNLLALLVTPANEQERAQVYELSEQVREVTGGSMKTAFVDQGYTGEDAWKDVQENGIKLEVVKCPEGCKGFVLLPRRRVVERSIIPPENWTAC